MLDDLDRTLRELLKRELSPALSRTEISFAPPNPEFINKTSLPAINLFLYDIQENLDLRETEWLIERQSDGTALRQRPPVRVSCSYVVTVWTQDPGDWQTEHHLLGEVMKALIRYPTLPAPILQGALQNQPPPPRSLALRPTQLQSLGEFWQAMGGKPKPALNYRVTIAVPVFETADIVPLVVSSQI
jgi:hypothetical protein